MGKYTAKLIILCYDDFGENHTPLQRKGMTAIPKNILLEFSMKKSKFNLKQVYH